jgi:hypothetical protein
MTSARWARALRARVIGGDVHGVCLDGLGATETNVVVTAPTTPPDEPPVPPQTNDAPYEVASASYTLTKVRTSPAGSCGAGGGSHRLHHHGRKRPAMWIW